MSQPAAKSFANLHSRFFHLAFPFLPLSARFSSHHLSSGFGCCLINLWFILQALRRPQNTCSTPLPQQKCMHLKERRWEAEKKRALIQIPLNIITTVHGNSKFVARAKFGESKRRFAFKENTFRVSKLPFPSGLLKEQSETHLHKNKMFQMSFTPLCGIQCFVGQHREALGTA